MKLDSQTGGSFLLRIRGSESACRNEWGNASQDNPILSISEIVTVIPHRHSIWPGVTEFPPIEEEID